MLDKGLTPKIRTTPSAKKEGAIIDIISRVEAFRISYSPKTG
jgi:hypothetical protein